MERIPKREFRADAPDDARAGDLRRPQSLRPGPDAGAGVHLLGHRPVPAGGVGPDGPAGPQRSLWFSSKDQSTTLPGEEPRNLRSTRIETVNPQISQISADGFSRGVNQFRVWS